MGTATPLATPGNNTTTKASAGTNAGYCTNTNVSTSILTAGATGLEQRSPLPQRHQYGSGMGMGTGVRSCTGTGVCTGSEPKRLRAMLFVVVVVAAVAAAVAAATDAAVDAEDAVLLSVAVFWGFPKGRAQRVAE